MGWNAGYFGIEDGCSRDACIEIVAGNTKGHNLE